ncbi:MAG: ABC transporter permease [Acidobacteria bacterium]|nr:ABC transporter permease [Acidobacteriota bacterium]
MNAPPRLVVSWLERRLHPDERHELIGDLTEQFQVRVQRDGIGRARRWFWREAMALGLGFALHRRDVVSMAHERTRGRWLLWNAASDWRYAWRSLWGARGATTIALLTLTCSLGLSTAVFSLTNSVLLQPLPYPSADRLVRMAEAQPEHGPAATSRTPVLPASGGSLSDTAVGQFIEHATTLEAVTAYTSSERPVSTPRGAQQRITAEVGTSFFDLLGVAPRRGRLFVQADGARDAPPSVVISESFWREALDAREDIIGTTLQIDQTQHVIVGVAAGVVRFPEPDIDLWMAGRWRWPSPGLRRGLSMSIDVIARLAPGATLDGANKEATQIAGYIAAADPGFLEGLDVQVPQFRIRHLQDDLVQPIRPALLALSLGMMLVLLAAAANLINLVLARSTARHREMAVRLTLGAARWRIVRPLLFEQLLLSGLGAVGGGLFAWILLRSAPSLAPVSLSQLTDVRFDVWSLLFAAGAALVIGVLVGLLPVWHLPGTNLRDLSSSGRTLVGRTAVSAEAVRKVLVAAQVALAVILLVGASLLGRTMWALASVDPGYQGEHALTFQVGLPDLIFQEPERQQAFFDQVLTRLRQHPSVVSAGASSTLPLNPVGISGNFFIEGRPRPADPADFPRAYKIALTPDYLSAVGTPVVKGRGFLESDTAASEPVALIDEATAARYFPNEDPLGARIDFIRKGRMVVGIVKSIKQRDVTAADEPTLYFPATQVPAVFAFNSLTGGIAVRTLGDPMDVVPFVRTAIAEVDPSVPVHAVARLDDRLSETFTAPRFYALALALFAGLALVVAILGVYGVLSYAVERRQMEFGVRRALGGDERHILRLVLRQATTLVAAGIVVGTAISVVGAGLLRSLLFGVEPVDVPTLVAAALCVWMIGLAAAGVPAWRAMRIDPARTLRAE